MPEIIHLNDRKTDILIKEECERKKEDLLYAVERAEKLPWGEAAVMLQEAGSAYLCSLREKETWRNK